MACGRNPWFWGDYYTLTVTYNYCIQHHGQWQTTLKRDHGQLHNDSCILFFFFLLLVTAWIHPTWRVFGWIQLKAPTVGMKGATKRLSLLMRDMFHLTVFRNTHISSVRTERIGGTVQRRQWRNSDGIWPRARQVQLLRQSLLLIFERV